MILFLNEVHLRKRVIRFTGFSLPGGACYYAAPIRKPHPKDVLAQVDPDSLSREFTDSLANFERLPDSVRRLAGTVLAERINCRRAIREHVLPELAEITKALADITSRLDRIEAHSKSIPAMETGGATRNGNF